jgi:hypothetical protein
MILRNESGLIAIDFIFALVLVFAFTAVLFALSMTLSVVEVTQYVTFASARNHFAAHVTKQKQEDLAREKYDQLISSPALKPLYNNGWFELKDFKVGEGTDYQQLQNDPDTFTFYGSTVFLRAPVLNFRVPFFGRTASDENSAFQAQIASWLAREPSTEECMNFNKARMQLIKQMGSNAYNITQLNENDYVVMTDNGC